MPEIKVTPQQEKELKSKGYAIKPAYDEVSNRRYYWDPRKDENGNAMGWTRPLPGDTLRMNYYLRKGLKLEDPEGNTAPPPGYFRRRTPAMPVPQDTEGLAEVSVTHDEVPPQNKKDAVLRCPLCEKEFPDSETLLKHMRRHESRKNKSKKGGKK